MFKINNKDTRTTSLTSFIIVIDNAIVFVDFPRRSGVFVVNFEQISHIVLVFVLLTLNN